MKQLSVISCVVLLQLLLIVSGADAAQRGKQKAKGRAKKAPAAAVVDPQMLATQVMLDRAGYSPGEIDGRRGTSTERALAAFTKNGGNGQALPQ